MSQFAALEESYFGFHKSEITSLGKIWINLEANSYKGLPEYEKMLKDVLNGKTVDLAKLINIAERYKNYKYR